MAKKAVSDAKKAVSDAKKAVSGAKKDTARRRTPNVQPSPSSPLALFAPFAPWREE